MRKVFLLMNKKPFDHKRYNAIQIDHLAFTVPVSQFKHFDSVNSERQVKWAKIPKRNWSNVKDPAGS